MDTEINIECVKQFKFGYYQVHHGKTIAIFENKFEAIEAAQRINGWISYHFNDDVFGCFDWQLPINDSLDNLYRKRAEQIRRENDYVVCAYSGGFDSHNMLQSFLANDIKIDAILFFYNSLSKGVYNLIDVEWESQTKHRVEEILQRHPEIEFYRIDLSPVSLDVLRNQRDSYKYMGSVTFAPNNAVVANHLVDQLPSKYRDNNTCVLLGEHKPRLRYKNKQFIANFLDVAIRQKPDYKFSKTQYFYWNRDLPELVIKQAQVAKNYWQSKITELDLTQPNAELGIVLDHNDVGMNRAIYPHCEKGNFLTFPMEKYSRYGQLLGERDTWLYNSNMPEAEQLFDLYKSLCSNLNSRWFNNNDYAKGLMGHISRDYIL